MELAKKSYVESYVESYVDSKVAYTDVGKLSNGNYSYPVLASAKAVIFLFKSDSNNMYQAILNPNSFNITDNFTITLAQNGGIALSGMPNALYLIGFLAFY